jgi:hypothetical protein
VTYGFGQRISVGKHLAKESLFMKTVRILWAASLERTRDENGKELPRNPKAFMDKGGQYCTVRKYISVSSKKRLGLWTQLGTLRSHAYTASGNGVWE